MIIKDRRFLNEDGTPGGKLLRVCIQEHIRQCERLNMLFNYLDGEHEIKTRMFKSNDLPNNKLVCNHASYIVDMSTAYVHGTPVQYSGNGSEELNDRFTDIDEDSHNAELAIDIATYGHALELTYMSDEEVPRICIAKLEPRNSFVVCDRTIEKKPMFAVSYAPNYDLDGMLEYYEVVVYTDMLEIKYKVKDLSSENFETIEEPKEHYFSSVPVTEYVNNMLAKGDFEPVITLIDAYNKLQSDRVNDKEQLIDALLAVSGVSFGDNEDEMTETAKLLKELRILELPDGGKAEWLTKNLNETEVEVLKKAIKDDIHEFSKVPCMTDENFASNASGVAMKYKLLGLEQLGKTKERYFKKGLRRRLQLISNIYAIKAKQLDVSKIDITMKRSLPVDDELLAKIAQLTDGFISWETRVKNFNPELDPDEEKKKLDIEKKENVEMQQLAYGSYKFEQTGGDE